MYYLVDRKQQNQYTNSGLYGSKYYVYFSLKNSWYYKTLLVSFQCSFPLSAKSDFFLKFFPPNKYLNLTIFLFIIRININYKRCGLRPLRESSYLIYYNEMEFKIIQSFPKIKLLVDSKEKNNLVLYWRNNL